MPSENQLKVDQLTEAREAYHELVTGRAPRVVVDQNGERVEFTAANRQMLYLYIQRLEAELGLTPVQQPRGPAGFVF